MKVEIVLSTVLAISTVLYTIINLMLWLESKATRKQKISPLLIAYLRVTENHEVLTLKIKNIGEGLATNVKIKTLTDYNRLGKDNLLLSEIGIIKNGFNIFPPQYELSFYLITMTKILADAEKSSIGIEICYENLDKKKYKHTYVLPFNQIIGQNYSKPPESFVGQIPFYLEEIKKILEKNLLKQR